MTSKYETRWYDGPRGGSIKRIHHRSWMSTPTVGMNEIRQFDNERDAVEWASGDLLFRQARLPFHGIGESYIFHHPLSRRDLLIECQKFILFGPNYSRSLSDHLVEASFFTERGDHKAAKRHFDIAAAILTSLKERNAK